MFFVQESDGILYLKARFFSQRFLIILLYLWNKCCSMKSIFRSLLGCMILLSFFLNAYGKTGNADIILPYQRHNPPFLDTKSDWVDSLMSRMTLEEKIAQLFMIAAYPARGTTDADRVELLIRKYKPGGLVFFQGNPLAQALLTNRFQAASSVPLFIAMDAEWGLAMRLDSTLRYPYQLMLGAIENDHLIYEMGRQIACQLKRLGVHISFSPVVDVNINPENPVISIRSFGENPFKVTMKGIAYAYGLQTEGILAVGKHFPGHGDTFLDSHLTLPVISSTPQRLDSIELFPFRYIVQSGISGIMTAHLSVPALDTVQDRPASVSPVISGKLLREDLGFKGLVFTDALNMKGVADRFAPGELEVKALMAGNDILLMPSDIPVAMDAIKKAVSDSLIKEEEINEHCRRVLLAKAWAGLQTFHPVDTSHLAEDLNKPIYEVLTRKLIREGMVLLKNADSLLPVRELDTLRIAAVNIGAKDTSSFQKSLALYAPVDFISIAPDDSVHGMDSLLTRLNPYNLVILSFSNTDIRAARNFGFSSFLIRFTDSLFILKPCIVSFTVNPYALKLFRNINRVKSILLAFDDDPLIQDLAGQAVFGGIRVNGRLPVTINDAFRYGCGLDTPEPVRFSYILPEEIGISRDSLRRIDSLACDMIRQQAAPGCQIFCAVNGKVFYRKSFGFHTYDSVRNVRNEDLYDLASITKISATLPLVMQLASRKVINLKGVLGNYFPEVRGTNKEKLILEDILAHQAGLEAWIPFYTLTLQPLIPQKPLFSKIWSEEYPFRIEKNVYLFSHVGYKPGIYQHDSSGIYGIRVADHLWLRNSWRDTIFRRIYESPVSKRKTYLYSDLGFILLGRMVESVTGEPLEKITRENFYQSLGSTRLLFNPMTKFPADQIVPTENDIFWRRQLVHGYVHDMASAMLGGVAGHAGLFGNSNDLAKLMQMYLNRGTYGGIRYLDSTIVDLFTSCVFCKTGNRRGLGFDKPLIHPNGNGGPVCPEASPRSFGHSGFTGTYTWADPDNGMLYVFLSNRVYPSMDNGKLIDMSYRTRIHSEFYRALKNASLPSF